MTSTHPSHITVQVAGTELCLLAEKALWWPERRTLLIADLHLGKAAGYRALGQPVPSGTTACIYGWSVLANGTLAPVPGMPYGSNGGSDIGVAQNFLFAADVKQVESWAIQSDGSLKVGPTSPAPWEGGASEGPLSLSFDLTQQDLYANYSLNGTYQAYIIGSNGTLQYVDYANADEASSWLSFTGNDAYGYQSACYHGTPGIYGYARASNGGLSVAWHPANPPQPSGLPSGGSSYCPWGAATIGNSNVIIAEVPTNAYSQTGPWQMVNFTIAADGSLTTTDTASTAPTVSVGGVSDYRFDPTGTWLAVGGTTGVQIFHWANGKLTSTSTVPIPAANGVFRLRWDDAGHLFVVNSNTDTGTTLYVFNVVNGVATPAPDSPRFIPGVLAAGLTVKPLS